MKREEEIIADYEAALNCKLSNDDKEFILNVLQWADLHPIGQRTFTMEELKQFVHDHIQSKIEHNELPLVGFDMNNVENFEREFNIFENTLLEGIINGISLCEGKVEGIDW